LIQRLSASTGIYIVLIIVLAALGATNTFLPQGSLLPEQPLPVSKPLMALLTAAMMLVVYGGLGFLGLRLSQKLSFPALWDVGHINPDIKGKMAG
jgi:hypothetical protein